MEAAQVKVFGKWTVEGITVDDPGLQPYINLTPRFAPRTGAPYARQRFHKSNTFILERLMNKLQVAGHKGKKHFMSSGHNTGKTVTISMVMREALELIEKRTGENPLLVVVKAIEYAAPREEVVSIEYGGARYPKAVECAPQRRVDLALRYITQGAYQKSFRSKKKLSEALAEELISAWQARPESVAISKKLELERQADASR